VKNAADASVPSRLLAQLSGDALAQKDWEGLQVIWERCDDTITAMPLYTSAVEGSRSTKRKKKSDAQKELISQQKVYKEACGKLEAAIKKKDIKTAEKEITSIRGALQIYREVAQIDKEDGGVIQLPESEEYEGAGHAGAPLGYVVPAFRGGGYKVSDVCRRPSRSAPHGARSTVLARPRPLSALSLFCSRSQYALR
jgi:hypothetical protein